MRIFLNIMHPYLTQFSVITTYSSSIFMGKSLTLSLIIINRSPVARIQNFNGMDTEFQRGRGGEKENLKKFGVNW